MAFIWILIIIAISVVASCLTTPMVYLALQTNLTGFASPYSRVFDRIFLLAFVLVFLIFRKRLSGNSILEVFKRDNFAFRLKLLGSGLALSLLGSYLIVPILVQANILIWANITAHDFLLKLLRTIPAALVIAVLEEAVFRLVIYASLRKTNGIIVAASLSSAIYAVAHFLSPDKSYSFPGYSIFEGFNYLNAVLSRFLEPGVVLGIVGLFLVGWVLSLAFEFSKSIYLSIGLHMGWILAVKTTAVLLDISDTVQVASGTGARYFLVSQPLGWLGVAFVGLGMFFVVKLYQRNAQNGSAA